MKSIVCFSAIDWAGLWQRPHSLMSRLAMRWPVVFVDNIGIRQIGAADVPRLTHKLRHILHKWENRAVSPDTPAGLSVLTPLAIPLHGWRLAAPINSTLVKWQLNRHLKPRDLQLGVLWINLPSPGLVRLANGFYGPVVYDCADEFTAFPGVPPLIAEYEAELLRRADLVITSAHSLGERKTGLARRTVVIPNGVTLRTAKHVEVHAGDRPAGHPVVGYVGAMHAWFDTETLEQVIRARPEWSFVLVGPVAPAVQSRLGTYPNVQFTGAVPAAAVPSYLKLFDVGIIPFQVSKLTTGVNPLKLYEYLAAGLPVVSADLPDVRRHGDMTYIYSDAADFERYIERAYRENSDQKRQRRREFASRFDWDTIASDVEKLLEPFMQEETR